MEHMKYVHKDPNASGVPGTIFEFLLLQSPNRLFDFGHLCTYALILCLLCSQEKKR